MKQIKEISLSGVLFNMEIDAYERLKSYLDLFSQTVPSNEKKDVMDDIESRMAEMFMSMRSHSAQVITIKNVDSVISQFGDFTDDNFSEYTTKQKLEEVFEKAKNKTRKKLFRDPDDSRIGGVCSGLAIYFGLEIALVRILFIVLFIIGTSTLWVYLILWIIVPKAKTFVQKLEMYGIPVNDENLKKYMNSNFRA